MKEAIQKDAKSLRILIAEDHEMVREGFASLINAQLDMSVVGEASSGRLVVQLAQHLHPDVVVLDVSMPDMNGLRATQTLIKQYPDLKILALTRHTDTGFIQQLLGAGVSGYVLKQSPSSDLIRAIRLVASGKKYLDPAIADKLIDSYAHNPNTSDAGSRNKLTNRETEVLKYIAWGYSNKEIGAKLQISVKTAEVHRANALKKLDISSRIDVVRYAILKGWLEDN